MHCSKRGGVSPITEHELAQLFTLAEKHACDDHLPVDAIQIGHYYSNGKLGSEWSVRHILDVARDSDNEDDQLVYKVVAGNQLHSIESDSRLEIAIWARYEVETDEIQHPTWSRLDAGE